MSDNATGTKRNKTLKLEGKLTIYEVGILREELLTSLNDAGVLEIDLMEVNECDTAGLQTLCSAKRTADQRDKKIVIAGIPMAVEAAMIKTGITHEMIAHDGGIVCQK
jgi:anti-anti-sigma regulatory factor